MNISEIERLARLLQSMPEIGSIEVRGWFGRGVVVTRNGAMGPAAVHFAPPLPPPPPPPPAAATTAPEGRTAPATPEPSTLREIKSPMVGTFYKAPEPGAEPYIKSGSRVAVGQTVCIIEAMKIMNEIEAEVGGLVREICVEDGQPVEFGTVLFRVDPHA